MRIGLHLTLMVIAELTAFAGGALAVWALVGGGPQTGAMTLLLMFAGAATAVLGVRWLFGHVAARCPRCGGRSFPRGTRPITYHCGRCGHTYETRWRSNW